MFAFVSLLLLAVSLALADIPQNLKKNCIEERDRTPPWFPSCLDDGSYAPVQCCGDVCWCSLGNGTVISGTQTAGLPICFGI
ncbi:hypothetical protein ACHWQZ_G003196 [Mnemiopsis leidyi]